MTYSFVDVGLSLGKRMNFLEKLFDKWVDVKLGMSCPDYLRVWRQVSVALSFSVNYDKILLLFEKRLRFDVKDDDASIIHY